MKPEELTRWLLIPLLPALLGLLCSCSLVGIAESPTVEKIAEEVIVLGAEEIVELAKESK